MDDTAYTKGGAGGLCVQELVSTVCTQSRFNDETARLGFGLTIAKQCHGHGSYSWRCNTYGCESWVIAAMTQITRPCFVPSLQTILSKLNGSNVSLPQSCYRTWVGGCSTKSRSS